MEKITIQKFLELRECNKPIDCSQYKIIGEIKTKRIQNLERYKK